MALLGLADPLRQFRLEPSPSALIVAVVLLLEQPECFFGAQLGDAGKVSDTKAVQDLRPLQFALAEAKGANNSFG